MFQTKFPAECKLPLVATDDDTGPLVKALISAEPGKNLLAFRELLTFGEFAETWGRSLGVKSKYVPVSPDGYWTDMPDSLKIDIEEGAAYISEFGFAGGDPSVVHSEDVSTEEAIDGRFKANRCSLTIRFNWVQLETGLQGKIGVQCSRFGQLGRRVSDPEVTRNASNSVYVEYK